MAEQERIQGTVKWFSNKKGYGFITTQDGVDVFCHQTQVDCGDAYRSLNKGWIVEFTVEKDEEDDNGKPKATRVTAVGGGPCTGPAGNKSTRRKQHVKRQQLRTNRDAADASSSPPPPPWHDLLEDHVKSVLHKAKRISTETGTLDVSVDETVKVKLGTAGYASMAHADGIVAEGTFACTPEGTVSLHWARAISFQNGEWQTTTSVSDLLSTFSLVDDNVERVGRNETPATLWGSDKPNPRKALEANGFQMRKVYLQRSGRNR